jgi:arylsulfatase B
MQKFAHIPDVQRRIFAAMLAQLDDGVGRVLATLSASGLEENTLVVFIADNGGPTKELTSSNAPLRGGKGELWEGGIRVPLIVSWKGHAAAGRTLDVPVSSMDATITALEVAGIASSDQLDGVSLLPLLTGTSAAAPHDTLFWRVGKQNALRRGDWKLIRDGGPWKLFNLAGDVGETVDLAAKQPQRVQELDALWARWNAEQVGPLWK